MKINISKQYLMAGILAVGLGVGGYAFAQVTSSQLSACVHKNGEARFIVSGFTKEKECEDNEKLVSWNKVNTQPHLYDASNQDLGIFTGHDLYVGPPRKYTTYLPNEKLFLSFISDSPNGPAVLEASGGVLVKFDGLDCKGQAFTENRDFPFQTFWRIYERNELNNYNLRYFTSYNSAQLGVDMTGMSVLYSDVKCENVLNPAVSVGFPLTEISLPFTEPISWPLHVDFE